ncbi:MAG: oxidoreductase [Mesorhizobium sp.]
MNSSPVWLITGCSTGFGRELAERVLRSGARLVVTARDASQVADIAAAAPDRAFALPLDVSSQSQIDAAVAAAISRFGQIDVLVNNAGYGYQAAAEEGVDAEIRRMFDTNVFGLFALTRAVLPLMRARRSGHIINISSVAGLVGSPGSGYYAASKHAVEGWSDSLRAELAPLGVRVTCVEPGPFRTDFAGRSLHQTVTRIDDYAPTAGARMASIKQTSGSQKGDPVRAANAIIELAGLSDPPRHIVFGAMGVDAVTKKAKALLSDIDIWRDVGVATDFPD